MTLSAFVRDHHELIIAEFGVFARTLMPAGSNMTEGELRDHAEDILTAVAADISLAQTPDEQRRKSQGHGTANTMAASGRLHADDRIQHGFSFLAVLAEFRALRATVLRLYEEGGGTDLAEVRRFNEAVDESLTESMRRFAEQTDRVRDQFIGILGHDLRTPLAAVTTGAALLALPDDNPQRRGRVVARIMNSAQRMERMIGDLLDLTRARLGGTIPLKKRRVDLQQLCEAVVLELRASRPDAMLDVNASGNLVGDWDADRLTQVISNLVGNAIEHGDGTPVTVTTQEADAAAVRLTVHNGGRPIPPDMMPFVFEPLRRGRRESTGHGIGLGLFIARALTMAHGGDIHVNSSPDEGTTFTVVLPRESKD